MSNLDLWTQLSRTDKKFTKPFKRQGGFGGDSIDPLWRIMRMTEQFGPVGEGWTINEPQFEFLPVPEDKKILVFCWVSVQVNGKNPVWGVGGNCAFQVYPGRDGRPPRPHSNDEACKMAFTDAIGNALKAFGMSADIYLGGFDADKYVAEGGHTSGTKPQGTPPPRKRSDYQRKFVKPNGENGRQQQKDDVPGYLDDAPPCQPENPDHDPVTGEIREEGPDYFGNLDDEPLPLPVFKTAGEIATAISVCDSLGELAMLDEAYKAASKKANFRPSTKEKIHNLFEERVAFLNQGTD